jgi:hypothetical protein
MALFTVIVSMIIFIHHVVNSGGIRPNIIKICPFGKKTLQIPVLFKV